MSMTIEQTLIAAKELLMVPGVWVPHFGQWELGTHCSVTACMAVNPIGSPTRFETYELFERANGAVITTFNDSHTFAEVMEGFDKAIELAHKEGI